MDIKAISGAYEGKLTGAETINGLWKQGGQTFPLQLRKGATTPLKRLQEPGKPYSYQETEVTVDNKGAGIRLVGTLTLPQDKSLYPAVLLLTGSGPQDRDETTLGHKPFLVLTDYLTKQGFAVLRLDDRGIGKSGDNYATATTEDFASDAQAAFNYLKNHSNVNRNKVGLLGHSEGALIATKIAALNKDIAFVVFMGGSGVPGTELLVAQNEVLYKAAGVPQETLQKLLHVRRAQFEAAASTSENAVAAETIKNLEEKLLSNFTPAEQKGLGLSDENTTAIAAQLTTPWMRYFLNYNPVADIRKLKMPVLAIAGSKDLQVPAQQNLPAIEKALQTGEIRSKP
ncbi:alpha/beta hydrolase family protein [Pontibacter silvestris]|uniref:Alpha/beta hydrolase family protein n=1 Tax=Pontibacter silvestris TaxID=2305183 RepID=A0ABW4WYA0_9BACT|nr:alpha/beta fold hydrolase [Pontibacter silvestris]MCC9136701.1 alpha/beta fold hydrolase [Pontibacter silvestris]